MARGLTATSVQQQSFVDLSLTRDSIGAHGLVVDFTPKGRVSTAYIDIAMIRRNGALLQ